jgi:nitroreductase
MSRKSVRVFTNEQIADEILMQIVKAGMAAPSGENRQPWAFIIVTDRDKLDKLAENLPYAKMCKTATAAIVVCGVPSDSLHDIENAYWVQDCSAATENILLANESFGLSAVWTACHPYKARIEPVNSILEIPENIIPLNVIPLGYAKTNVVPKDKWNSEKVHFQRW